MKDHSPPIWNPFRGGYLDDPYQQLRLLREQNPVHRGVNGYWLIFRYEDVKFTLTSPKFRTQDFSDHLASKNRLLSGEENLDGVSRAVSKWLFFLDGQEHTQLRNLVMRVWTRLMVQDHIDEAVRTSIENLDRKRSVDIVEDFAKFIPIKVICKIMGLPYEDNVKLREWSWYCAKSLEPFENLKDFLEISEHTDAFFEYLAGVLEEKAAEPDGSFISDFLLQNRTLNEPVKQDDMISAFMLLFFAGIETTISLFSQSVLSLIDNPRQLQTLRDAGSIHPQAIEELVRITSPLQYTARIPNEDVVMGGHLIKKNETIWVCVASANRDPEVFENPEDLDLTRRHNPHLGFGYGLHHCVGATLAKNEMATALPAFLNTFSTIKLDPDIPYEWDTIISNRGLKTLPVVLDQ